MNDNDIDHAMATITSVVHNYRIQIDGLTRLGQLGVKDPDRRPGGLLVDWAADTIEAQAARIATLEAALRTIAEMNAVCFKVEYDEEGKTIHWHKDMDTAVDIARRALGEE